MRYRFFLSILIGLVFTSCNKKIDLDLPKQPAQLAVHALWDRDSVFEVTVTHSYNIAEAPTFNWTDNMATYENVLKKYVVRTAKVVIYKDGLVYDELVYNASTYRYKSSTGKKATVGATYSVKVEAPDYPAVSAPVLTFPEQVAIQLVEVRNNTGRDEVGNRVGELTFVFNDPAAVRNYYCIDLFRENKFMPSRRYEGLPFQVFTVDNDIVVPVGDITTTIPSVMSNQILFKDDNFNGQEKRLTIRMPAWMIEGAADPNGSERLIAHLKNIPEDMFLHIRSQIINSNNPFSTPVQIYSNLTGGQGIFGVYTGYRKIVLP